MVDPRRTSAVAVVLLVGAAAPASADGAHDAPSYVTMPAFAIWCEHGGHDYAPQGVPDDHNDPLTWLFSGEPECLAGDTVFGTEEDHGYGGIGLCMVGSEWSGPRHCEDHRGHGITITADDALGHAPVVFSAEVVPGQYVEAFGCGSVSTTIPEHIEGHWNGFPQIVWILVDPILLDADTLELCLASTGTLTLSY